MIAGHTRCLVDGCFGLLQRKYRRSDCFTLDQLAAVVNSSAAGNVAQVYHNSGIVWRAWDDFLPHYFKPVPAIRKIHHILFEAASPDEVFVKESIDGEPRRITILKTSKEAVTGAGLPPTLTPGGPSLERQRYLHKEIRPFVPPAFHHELSPEPDEDS